MNPWPNISCSLDFYNKKRLHDEPFLKNDFESLERLYDPKVGRKDSQRYAESRPDRAHFRFTFDQDHEPAEHHPDNQLSDNPAIKA